VALTRVSGTVPTVRGKKEGVLFLSRNLFATVSPCAGPQRATLRWLFYFLPSLECLRFHPSFNQIIGSFHGGFPTARYLFFPFLTSSTPTRRSPGRRSTMSATPPSPCGRPTISAQVYQTFAPGSPSQKQKEREIPDARSPRVRNACFPFSKLSPP